VSATFKCGHAKTLANTYYTANNRDVCAECHGTGWVSGQTFEERDIDVVDYFDLSPEERLRRYRESGM